MDYKKYFYSLFPFIYFSLFVFGISIFYGYLFIAPSIEDEEGFLSYFQTSLDFIINASSIEQFFFIFISNTITLFLTVFLGFTFAFFPFLVLFSNGTLIGILMFYFKEKDSLDFFFLAVLPHGIIEIPILIIGGAIGFKIGKIVFDKIFRKEGNIKEEFFLAFIFFSRILFPLLFLTALIEIFFTKAILELFI